MLGEDLEIWHRKFMRTILRLPSTSVCSMVYGELGRMPLHHRWQKHVLRFWNRLLETPNDLLRAAFLEGYGMARESRQLCTNTNGMWCYQVEKLILEFAAPGPLSVYEELDVQQYSKMVYQSFRDKELAATSPMSTYYRMYKQHHVYSSYLSQVKNLHLRTMLTRFR